MSARLTKRVSGLRRRDSCQRQPNIDQLSNPRPRTDQYSAAVDKVTKLNDSKLGTSWRIRDSPPTPDDSGAAASIVWRQCRDERLDLGTGQYVDTAVWQPEDAVSGHSMKLEPGR
jgi:hypothetical protein